MAGGGVVFNTSPTVGLVVRLGKGVGIHRFRASRVGKRNSSTRVIRRSPEVQQVQVLGEQVQIDVQPNPPTHLANGLVGASSGAAAAERLVTGSDKLLYDT